jgi:DNA topoisomerase-2
MPDGYKPIIDETNERWSVGICYSPDGFKQISFVNGIHTTEGGSHVDHVVNLISKEIIDKLKSKKIEVKPSDIKNRMILFIKCAIEEPDFRSQSKEHLKMPVSKFGSTFVPSEIFKKKLHTCDILKSMLEVSEKAKMKNLSKTNGKKLNRIVGIDTLEDAAWAGSNKALKTKLILTEGLSAKTFAMRARSVIGYDRFGIFPLKGKMLNVRNVNITRVSANEEIKNLVKILGLNYDMEYKNTNDLSTLRYGGIIALADADHDGNHICGLIINYIHTFWPSLIEKGFVNMIATPIVKVFKTKETLSFYTMNDYEKWAENAKGAFKVKYYKGLGSSMESDAKEALKNIDDKIIEFIRDEHCDDNVKLAFESSQSDQRKDWLMNKYDPKSSMDRTEKKMPVSTFINKELIHFSIYDCERSIPALMDGFKPSQRKIMYVALEYAVKHEMKVGQLGPKVSEKTDYHHGETSLMGAIIGMAQDFIGSNNINLLLPNGAFGSRLSGGADAASPRYIFTQVNPVANIIFDKRDNSLLEHAISDGIKIEPKWFYPIIPMILINGTLGIATGYSTKILSYNPIKIIDYLITKLSGNTPKKTLMPWYKGFKGEITKVKSGTYNAYGVWKFMDGSRSIHITELPVGVWTDDYKSFIDKIILENGPIAAADYRNDSTNIDITLQFTPGAYEEYKIMDPEVMTKKLKLRSTMSTTNMVLFNSNGMITKYASVYGIITEFFEVRLDMYNKRRDAMIDQLKYEMLILSNKAKFIRSVKKGDIDQKNMTEKSLLTAMETGYDKDPRSIIKSGLGMYNYLIDMGYRSFTEENAKKMDKLVEDKMKEIEEITNTTAEQMWKSDLDLLKAKIV